MWLAKFTDSDEMFIAVGRDQIEMRTFTVDTEGEKLIISPLPMLFPSCLRFMPYAEVTFLEQVPKKEIEEEYGPLPDLPKPVDEDENVSEIPPAPVAS